MFFLQNITFVEIIKRIFFFFVKLQISLRVHKVMKLYPVLSVLNSSDVETTVVIRVSRNSIPPKEERSTTEESWSYLWEHH
jgi:hypothetical protein